MRTFSREDWLAAAEGWADFSEEWAPFRRMAAHRGFIYPPSGTRWDTWEDDSPSQRAILVRAIRETPALLRSCIAGSSSWSQVVSRLAAERDEWRARSWEQSRRERAAAVGGAGRDEAPAVLADLLRRIGA